MIVSSFGARIVGLCGTLVITRFLAPSVMGEVTTASVISMTTGWLSTWGFGQYAVIYGRGDDATEVTWHATVAYTIVGIAGFSIAVALAPAIATALGAPYAAHYVPGLALAAIVRRVGATPERVLTRSLRFSSVAIASASGDTAYAVSATCLVAAGLGGDGIIVANVIQSATATAMLVYAAGWRTWATPTRLRWTRFVAMLRFGVPLALQSVAHSASRYWGTFVVLRVFGTAAAGAYGLAYNLADIPAIYIGEQLTLVLMPSLASLPEARRPAAFERACRLLGIILFPLAIGLGVVAHTAVALLLSPRWQGVAPLLAVLSALSVSRPITCALSAYLEAHGLTGRLFALELANLILLLGGMRLLAPLGLTWSAAAVGIAFGLYALAGIAFVARRGLSLRRLAYGFARPLAACGAMTVAVFAVRMAIAGRVTLGAQLAAEIIAGALAYIAVILVVARDDARDLIDLARHARA
jgi:PST family polysaccharide transporter